MKEKKYLAKIIAKDPNGLQVISACCSEGSVRVDEIKFLKKINYFFFPLKDSIKKKTRIKKLEAFVNLNLLTG